MGNSPINDIHLAKPTHHHIVRLDVAVKNSSAMRKLDGLTNAHQNGEVHGLWACSIAQKTGNTLAAARQITGPAVATTGIPARYVFAIKNAIAVVNTSGEVWVHDVLGSTLSAARQMKGPAVASSGVPARCVFSFGNRIAVVNTNGELWAHTIQGSTLTAATRIAGAAVALEGVPARYVFPLGGSRIAVVNTAGEVWALEVR